MKKITLLGATGSIGCQTLEVIGAHPDKFSLVAMSFGKNITSAMVIIHKFQPGLVCVGSKQIKEEIAAQVPDHVKIVYGQEGLTEAAVCDSDLLVNAVVGSAGLRPTLNALREGKPVALANKETLACAGHLVMAEAKRNQQAVLPIDSEHSAIFQCLRGEHPQEVARLMLTASGGSFRDYNREQLQNVTVEDALQHPNWAMGAKNTIDSATMANKGLEVIEAHWLFDIPYDQIEVTLHRESIVHSMVEFRDRSVMAQLSEPDMRIPIQYALSFPQRLELRDTKRLNLGETAALHFENMDLERFPCLAFAYKAGESGGTMPTVFNAANEQAVELFLDGRLSFLGIEQAIEAALARHTAINVPELATIQSVDEETRRFVASEMTNS